MSFGMRGLPTNPESRREDARRAIDEVDPRSVAVVRAYRGAVDRDDALARVRSARAGRLATVTPDGGPHVVPFVFALVERGSDVRAYWAVDRKPKRTTDLARIHNLERNPAVEFVVDDYDEDWTGLWWVRCSGTGRVVTDEAERRLALEALGAKYPQYELDPPEGPVLVVDVQRVSGWSSAEM
jgi:PPOX class probable F420-dependent enzyme